MTDDFRIDVLILRIGRKSLRFTRSQRQSLALLCHLSEKLRFVEMSESSCEYAPAWIRVEVDGGRLVDVEDDGGLELLDRSQA